MNSISKISLAAILFSIGGMLPSALAADQPLVTWSQNILAEIKSPAWTDASCVPYLTNLSAKIDVLGSSGSLKVDELKAQAPALTTNLWQSRLALHDRLSGASDSCATEIRNAFRKFRFLEDFLGEITTNVTSISPDGLDFQAQPVPLMDAPAYYLTQSADGTGQVQLQEGDIMMARGVSFLSAMIARLGDVDSQFSHAIIVAKNPNTGVLETIESYVGEGVNFHEIHWALKNENSRLVVLRAKDHAMAVKAAQEMWANVNGRTAATHIHYDYNLDFNDPTTMSCVEVVKVEFVNASGGAFTFPERPSSLNRGRDLLKRLGITAGPTFTPGDLEDDSRFDIVGEYRDLRLTRDSRLKDAILSKMLEWMDNEQYTLHPDLMAKLARGPVWTLRHTFLWPMVRKILGADDFSAEIPRSMVGTVKLITEYGTGVLKALQTADEAQFQATGMRMTYNDLYAALEKIKTDDEATFANRKTRKNSILIKYLRAE